MLMAEWNWEEAEALLQKDFLEIGMEKGMEKGREEGWEKRGFEIARNALAKGFPPETISELTGLDTKTIQSLSTQQ